MVPLTDLSNAFLTLSLTYANLQFSVFQLCISPLHCLESGICVLQGAFFFSCLSASLRGGKPLAARWDWRAHTQWTADFPIFVTVIEWQTWCYKTTLKVIVQMRWLQLSESSAAPRTEECLQTLIAGGIFFFFPEYFCLNVKIWSKNIFYRFPYKGPQKTPLICGPVWNCQDSRTAARLHPTFLESASHNFILPRHTSSLHMIG